MRKTIALFLSFVFVFLFFLFTGCDRRVKTIDNKITFNSILVEETYHIDDDQSKSACNLRVSFIFPDSSQDEQLTKMIQAIFIKKMYGDSFKSLSPKKATEGYTQQYIEAFKQFESIEQGSKEENELERENEYADETGYAYYTWLKDTIVFNQNNFISFSVESLVYEGGAHSSQNINGCVINLETGKLLQEEDFAGIHYKNGVSKILAQKIAKDNGLTNPADLENLGYNPADEIVPNNNFTIDNKGITYYFNENEIAGTMVGLTKVFIPYEEINIYMKKDNPISLLSK